MGDWMIFSYLHCIIILYKYQVVWTIIKTGNLECEGRLSKTFKVNKWGVVNNLGEVGKTSEN